MSAKTISEDSTVVAADQQISTELDGETVILQLERGIYYGLDGIGARVWEKVREPTPFDALCADILESFEVEPERCADDLRVLLEELLDVGLIELVDPSST